MRRTFFIICLVLCNYALGQVRYKVEYDYNLTANFPSSGSGSSIEVYVTARLENGSSDSNFLNAVFSSPGNTNHKKDEVLQYSGKIKSFDVLHFASSGNPTCPNNGDTKTFSFSGSECTFLPFATSNSSDCFFFQQIGLQKLFPLEDFESLNPNFSNVIPECKKRSVLVSTYCDFSYKVEARFNGSPPITVFPYGERSGSFDFELADIDGLKINELFEIRIVYAENPSANEISNWISSSFVACSLELDGPPEPKNATCNGNTDGTVKLNFKEDVETGYEMRYYIYEGNPSDFPANRLKDKEQPVITGIQVVDDPLITLNSDFEGSYTGLGAGDFFIVYQEIKYNGLDVTVKSGEITPQFTIRQPSKINPSATITQPLCNSAEANINFSAMGGDNLDGSGTYSYQYRLNGGAWTDAITNPQPINATSNEQTVDIKAIYATATNNGCESEVETLADKINAVVPPLQFNNPSPGIASSGNSDDGVISINYDGGVPNYTFALQKQNGAVFEPVSNPDSIHNPLTKKIEFRDLGVGTYRITLTDSNACSLTTETIGDIAVTITPPPTIDSEEVLPITCTGPNDGSITVNLSGGVTPYNYQWTINGTVSPIQTTGANTTSLNNLSEPGEYILKIASNGFTDFNDPSGYATTTVTLETPVPVIINSTTITNISCNGTQDGSIVVDASGATDYQYKLDAFDNWQDLNGNTIPILTGGVYDLYLRNKVNGCEAVPMIDALQVDEPDKIQVVEVLTAHRDVSSNGGNDGAIEIAVSGGNPGVVPNEYSFVWSGALDNGSTYTNTVQNIDNLLAGTYQVTVTDANGCSPIAPLVIEITEPGPLAINDVTIQNEISCAAANDGNIVADVTGNSPITFEWTRDGAPFRTLTDENVLSNVPHGAYQLFLTDASGAAGLQSGILTLVAPSVITADVTASGSCFAADEGTITISNVQGGTAGNLQDYTYSIDDGNSFKNNPLFENLEPGNYTVRVRDGNQCDFIQTDVIVTQFPAITWDAVNSQVFGVTAAGRTDGAISPVFLGGTPPFSYNWTGPNISGTTVKDVTGLAEGTYTIAVTDANNCSIDQIFEITEPGELLVNINQSVFLECNGDDFGEITASIQGGVPPYTIEWFQTINGNDNLLPEDTVIIGNLSAGTYFVRVTDANAIIVDSESLEIIEPDILEITLENTIDVLCSGEATGAISVSVSGGTPPYAHVWSNGAVTRNIIGVEAGEYTLEVIDGNNCFTEITATINAAPDALRIANTTVTNVSEYLASDGSIALDIAGGTTPYTIDWRKLSDNGDAGNGAVLSALSADSYRVAIFDANGCSVTETYEITQPDIVEETLVPPTCAGDTNGSISLLVNRGNGTFTYEWSTGATTNTINSLAAGNYSVTITGFGNGPITRNYLIENPEPLSVDLGENRTLCADQELVLDATVENESAVYSWTSDNGFSNNTPTVALTQTGNYTVTITTPTGCTAEGSIFVDISTDEIDAEFAVSSQVFVNETFVAVDISYPLPDSLEWILPDEATVLKKNGDEVELRFDTPGEYDIEIITTRGNCIAEKTKKIIVVAPEGTVTKEDAEIGKKLIEDFICYPNPSNGEFTAEVNLTERGNISIKVFSFANNAMMASEKDRGELNYSIPFDLSGLPAGVYAVLLETPYGNTLRKVILK